MKMIWLFFLLVTCVWTQSITSYEEQYFLLQEKYQDRQLQIDSLNDDLNKFLLEIERVKEKEPGNRDKISSQMALALEKSNHIDALRKTQTLVEKEMHQKRQYLYKNYTLKIDSLRNINKHAVNKKEIESQLKELNNKRLYVAPVLTQLSFDPGLVEKIQLSHSRNDKEKKIYKEYLDNALNEVDSNIVSLQQQTDNIREVIRLNEQAEDFMDDIQGNQFTSTFLIREQGLANRNSFNETDWNSPIAEMNGAVKIYNRISPFIYENVNKQDFTLQDSVYTEDYLKLLEETEKTLRLYREKIKDKLQ
jgi:hypothetical protein